MSNKFICRDKYIYSAGFGSAPKISPHQPKKSGLGWTFENPQYYPTQAGLRWVGLGLIHIISTCRTSYEAMKRAWFWTFVETEYDSEDDSTKDMQKPAYDDDEKKLQNSCFEIVFRMIRRIHVMSEKLKSQSKSELRREKLIRWMSDWSP